MAKKTTNAAKFLRVEDSPADVLMTRETFEQTRLVNTPHVVEDGVQALEFLHKEGIYASSLTPNLILLDLNLPHKSGIEVLDDEK